MVYSQVDPSAGSWISLIGNFGIGGAVLAAVYFFLAYLKEFGADQAKQLDATNRRCEEQNEARDRRFEELVGRVNDRLTQQGEVIRDNSQVIRDFHAAIRANQPPKPRGQG